MLAPVGVEVRLTRFVPICRQWIAYDEAASIQHAHLLAQLCDLAMQTRGLGLQLDLAEALALKAST